MAIEAMGKPTTTLIYQYFSNDAQSTASSRGMPNLRVIPEPIVSECTVTEEIEAGVAGVFDQIIANLTRPLTAEERVPKAKESEKLSRISFKGNLAEVNRFFYQRGWTDGLPVIPPTEEAVAEMVAASGLPADHLVAKAEPRRGKATVEQIAINAVMAGALPSYMPVLIAGVKVFTSNPASATMTVSTGSWSPFWVINGPVRKALNLNSSYGTLNPGDIANATIGRAMSLILKNIGGIRKGIEDMGVFGNPGRYTMVAAENEEESPWEPLHVEAGLKKEDSAITLSFPHAFQQLNSYATDDKGILATIVSNLYPGRMGLLGIILTPPVAKALGSRGWTKKKIKEYLVANAKTTLDHTTRFYSAPDREKMNPNEVVPIFPALGPRPPEINIYVFGGYGSWEGLLSGGSGSTAKIELPANWEKTAAKYRNVVPSYARY